MAEPALAAANAAASAATDIKQEHDLSGLEGLDFTLPPELAAKRPFQDVEPTIESPEAKRARMDNQPDETSLEDGLALLVQNALSNVGDLVDQFGDSTNDAPDATVSDPMDLDISGPSISEPPAPRPTFSSDPQRYVQDVNLHALGNLVGPHQALSLLLILVQPPFEETMKSLRDSESNHGRSYGQLRRSLDSVRQLYSSHTALSTHQLDIRDPDSQTLIELANLAQLGSWLVDGTPKSLSDADDNFLALFQCQISDLSADMTELYLSIKTQRAIEFLVEKEPEKASEEVIGEILIQGLEDALREQHGGGELTSADQSFVSSVQNRKETLQGQAKEQEEPAALRDKHPAEDLVRSYFKYVIERLKQLTDLGSTLGVSIQLNDSVNEVEPVLEATGDADLDLDDLSSFFEKTASGLVQNALAGLTEEDAAAAALAMEGGESLGQNANAETTKTDNAPSQPNGKIDLMTDYKELEALVAESTSNYVKTTLHGLSPVPYQPTVPTSTTESMAAQLPYLAQLQHHQQQHPYYTYTQPLPEPQAQPPAPGENLPPNQTFPSAILYDKARQAALSKSSAHTRREGIHSTRRPWTQEEEKALMAGLDMVKGPHWSQILTLFGQSGTISDILKDRTQVQLKDKARNLKLFFLKTNSEMPYYLQAVTGELKTRAPTQAARKEAEERARLNSEEDQAKLQGIMALAGGLQHPPQGRTSASPANTHAAPGVGLATPAQAAGAAHHASTAQHPAGHAAQTMAGQRPTIAPGSQFRTSMDANGHQTLQSMPQAPPRPQAHLPPQVPRPQSQQQHQPPQAQATPQQQQQTQQTQHIQQQQQQQQQGQALRPAVHPQAAVANGQAQAQPRAGTQNQTTPSTQQQPSISIPTTTAAQPTPGVAAKAPTQYQQTPSAPTSAPASQPAQTAPAPAPAPTLPAAQPAQPPKIEEPIPQDDNAAEAALLEGLQAVVAQSLASS